MASKNKSLITSLALTALVGICASLPSCTIGDVSDDGDGGAGGETGGDGDGDMGGAGGATGGQSSTGGTTSTGGATSTGGSGTGGSAPTTATCEFAESCDDETIAEACYAITANFRKEITEIAVPCMNEGGCDESITSEDCLAIAYEQADLTEYEADDYCGKGVVTTCGWDEGEALACDEKIYGIQTAAQVDFEDCLESDEGMCDPTLCVEILR